MSENIIKPFAPVCDGSSYEAVKVAFRSKLIGENPKLAELTGLVKTIKQGEEPKEENKRRRRYPKDKEALAVLKEARRRKGEDAYDGDSNERIIELMVNEGGNAAPRILYGKLNGKAKGQGREKKTPNDREDAVELWGKYLSEYIKWHPLKVKVDRRAEPSAVKPSAVSNRRAVWL